jgi:mRNA interferase RelE/StbE
MTWQVLWTPRALKDIRKLEQRTRERVLSAVERYAATSAGDVLQLTGIHPPEWRLRIGDWRVRFQKDAVGAALLILRVLPRDKVY